MELVFQEDWIGDDGQGWPIAWSAVETFGTTSRTIQSNTGQQSVEDDFNYRYDVVTFDTVRNIDVTVVFDTRDISTPGSHPGLLARWNEPDDGYYFEIDAQEGGGGSVTVYSAPSYSIVVSGAANLTFLSNTRYLVRLFMEGSTIRLKVWEEGTTEPGTWYIDTTDGDWSNAGWVGLSMYSTDGARDVRWDDLSILAFVPDITYQPLVEIVTETVVEFDPEFLVQPDVEITTLVVIDYTPPPSTGGQPNLITTMNITTILEPQIVTTDASGHTEIILNTSGKTDVDLAPIPVPEDLDFVDVNVTSVTMPRPEEFDQFGRPIA